MKVKGQPQRTDLIICGTEFLSILTLTEANPYVIPCHVIYCIATAKSPQIYRGFADTTAQKMTFSPKYFLSKFDQIPRELS